MSDNDFKENDNTFEQFEEAENINEDSVNNKKYKSNIADVLGRISEQYINVSGKRPEKQEPPIMEVSKKENPENIITDESDSLNFENDEMVQKYMNVYGRKTNDMSESVDAMTMNANDTIAPMLSTTGKFNNEQDITLNSEEQKIEIPEFNIPVEDDVVVPTIEPDISMATEEEIEIPEFSIPVEEDVVAKTTIENDIVTSIPSENNSPDAIPHSEETDYEKAELEERMKSFREEFATRVQAGLDQVNNSKSDQAPTSQTDEVEPKIEIEDLDKYLNDKGIRTDSQEPTKDKETASKNDNLEPSLNTQINDNLDYLLEAINEINPERLKNAEKQLEESKKTREKYLEELKARLDKDNQVLFANIDTLSQSAIAKKQVIDNKIESEKIAIKPIIDDVEEQRSRVNQEKEELAKKQEEYNQKRNDPNAKLSEVLILEADMEKLEQSIEIYEEYIDYFEKDIIESNQKIEELEIRKQEIDINFKETKQQYMDDMAKPYGGIQKEKGKISINPEKAPQIVNLDRQIETISQEIALYSTKPDEYCNELKRMVEEKAPANAFEEKLNLFVDLVGTSEVNKVLKINRAKHQQNQELLINLENEKKDLEAKINAEEERKNRQGDDKESAYFKKHELEKDEKAKEELSQKIEEYNKKILELNQQITNRDKKANLSSLKRQLAETKKRSKSLEIESKYLLDESDLELNSQSLKKSREREAQLVDKIEELKAIGKVKSLSKMKKELEKLQEEEAYLNEQLQEYNDKDYIDYDSIATDKKKAKNLDKQIESIKKDIEFMETKKVTDVKNLILGDYKDHLKENSKGNSEELGFEEIVESYEDAPKGLLQKVQSVTFVKFAQKNFKVIVASVLAVATLVGGVIYNKIKNNNNQKIEEEIEVSIDTIEETKDKADIDIALEEPTVDITKENNEKVDKRSQIERIVDSALEDYANSSKDNKKKIFTNATDAALQENSNYVIDNGYLYENAKPGDYYTVTDGQAKKINQDDIANYLGSDLSYSIVDEDGNTLGYSPLQEPEELENQQSGKTR